MPPCLPVWNIFIIANMNLEFLKSSNPVNEWWFYTGSAPEAIFTATYGQHMTKSRV